MVDDHDSQKGFRIRFGRGSWHTVKEPRQSATSIPSVPEDDHKVEMDDASKAALQAGERL